MLEIEMKFPAIDFGPIVARLQAWGAKTLPLQEEADHYHNAPDRDFARTDEAFRLRRIGLENLITYKGPKQPGPTKTRTEIEIPLQEGNAVADQFLRLLGHLGYRPSAVVHKKRQAYAFQRGGFDLHVCLDDVDELGRFLEVEIVAVPENRDAAQEVLLDVVGDLGLSDPEPRSYIRMLLEKRAAPV